jgi:hypothetical protein
MYKWEDLRGCHYARINANGKYYTATIFNNSEVKFFKWGIVNLTDEITEVIATPAMYAALAKRIKEQIKTPLHFFR